MIRELFLKGGRKAALAGPGPAPGVIEVRIEPAPASLDLSEVWIRSGSTASKSSGELARAARCGGHRDRTDEKPPYRGVTRVPAAPGSLVKSAREVLENARRVSGVLDRAGPVGEVEAVGFRHAGASRARSKKSDGNGM